MNTREKIIEKHQSLFKKYKQERDEKLQKYVREHNLVGTHVSELKYPGYYAIYLEWDIIKKVIDKPVLKLAKYKINQELEFLLNDPQKRGSENKILARGSVVDIRVSQGGSAEIIYIFDKLTPNDRQVSPVCMEKNIIGIFKKTKNGS